MWADYYMSPISLYEANKKKTNKMSMGDNAHPSHRIHRDDFRDSLVLNNNFTVSINKVLLDIMHFKVQHVIISYTTGSHHILQDFHTDL